ncbi:hypothetical protein EV426DRAFT_644893 [Tirmania nivea]|nr:hypothetical protein EV426DRAFT_644893 [Tirmania nivea]
MPKIPTKLCYCARGSHQGSGPEGSSRYESHQYNWGLQVSQHCPEPREFFKLLLDPETTNGSFGEDIPGSFAGSHRRLANRGASNMVAPEDMVKHFLSAMLEEFYVYLRREYKGAYKNEDFTIEWVFTVPAFFSPEMVGRLQGEIIPAAGFVGSISTLLEPEGAATSVLIDAMTSQTPPAAANEKILVCDAGGGTTDLFAFEIKSLEQSSSGPHLQMRPLGGFCGGLIGAMDINEAFDVFLHKAWKPIGESSNDERHILESYRQRDFLNAHRRFDEYKTAFNENDIPRPIEFNETVGVASIPKAGIDCGVLDLSKSLMKKFFDDVIFQVLQLVQGHIAALENNGHVLQAMIFVGGLAASPYVRRKMEAWTQTRNIRLITPQDRYQIISAVMRGAVQHKLHERIQRSSPTLAIVQRSSFGYVLDEEYDPARHTIHLNYSFDDAFTGRKMAGRQIRWLVRKGDTLYPDEQGELIARTIHRERFTKGQLRKWTYTVVRTEQDDIGNLPTTVDTPGVIQMAQTSLDLTGYDRRDRRCFQTHWRHAPSSDHRWLRWGRKDVLKYFETEVHLALRFRHGGFVEPIAQSSLEVQGLRPKRRSALTRWLPGKAYK